MAADDTLPIPLDIPWRLAGTTMERTSELDPIGSKSSISLFYYEPAVDSLATDYPTDRVIYLKVLASICPAKLPADPADPSTTDLSLNYRDYLEGQSGVWHALLDIGVRPDQPGTPGVGAPSAKKDTMRPYFHAVAPVRREMVQTGPAPGGPGPHRKPDRGKPARAGLRRRRSACGRAVPDRHGQAQVQLRVPDLLRNRQGGQADLPRTARNSGGRGLRRRGRDTCVAAISD